jgi:hypothetical protein
VKPEVKTEDKPKTLTLTVPGLFHGQNKGIALRLYNTLLAVPELKAMGGKLLAHKIAGDYIADIGNALANAKPEEIEEIATKVSKLRKDGGTDHSFRMVARGIKSPAGTIAQIVSCIDEMHKQQAIAVRFFPPWESLLTGVQDYLNDSVEFCAENWQECTAKELEEHLATKKAAKESTPVPAK